jgi:hypothetical protein
VAGTTPLANESSKVLFIDLAHPFAPPFPVDTGGTKNCVPACRADELAYDPRDHLILVANDRAQDLFVTLISTEDHPHVVGKIHLDGSTPGNPKACDLAVPTPNCGIEQPVWDKKTKKFYIAIPATTDHLNGEVDEIDPNAMPRPGDTGQGRITHRFPTACGPAGLALIPKQRLMTSCGEVLEAKNGAHVTTVAGVAADEIWFNSGDERVYFGHNPAYVVDAETYEQIVDATNSNGPPLPAKPSTHSIAADSENNRIFIPVGSATTPGPGVLVYTDEEENGKRHDD